MVDDIRPRPSNGVEKNKDIPTPEPQAPTQSLEAPHLYGHEDGFVAAKAARKLKDPKFPKFKLSSLHPKHATKKQKIIGAVIIGVLLICGAYGVYSITKAEPPVQAPAPVVEKKEEPPKKTTEPSKLTGVEINPELNKRPIVSIQIENSPDARPQSGLKDAGVVFEAIAEGGITRFNASFLEAQPDYIGPVRSVRPYYAALAAPFDPVFVHAGGSADGLAKLRELGLKDMDHGANGGAFRRVSDRYAPHNLYTSMAELDKASAGRGYTGSTVKSLLRKAEKPGQPVTAKGFNLNISSALYNVHYDYDAASNSYMRSMAGKPHTDQRSGAQLSSKVVVALVMSFSQNGIYSIYNYNGSGKAVIFQDGQAQDVTWTKASDKEQLTFTDAAGKPVALNAGQTWFSLVKSPNDVALTP